MNPIEEHFQTITRRAFLGGTAAGLGAGALNSLLTPRVFCAARHAASGDRWPGGGKPLDHPAKIKRVIYLYQAGGPSHLETFDFKPKLREMNGQEMPTSFTKGQQIAQLQGKELKCRGAEFDFARFGQSGQEMCSLF